MKTRLSVIETYKVDTESEATEFIEEMKEAAIDHGYEISAYHTVRKVKKAKGEIVAEGYEVKVVKHFSDFWDDIEL